MAERRFKVYKTRDMYQRMMGARWNAEVWEDGELVFGMGFDGFPWALQFAVTFEREPSEVFAVPCGFSRAQVPVERWVELGGGWGLASAFEIRWMLSWHCLICTEIFDREEYHAANVAQHLDWHAREGTHPGR